MGSMNQYFRDTVFGQTVRLLSNNRLLKFPDELDSTLWKQCITKHTTAPESPSEDEHRLAKSKGYTNGRVAVGKQEEEKQGAGINSTDGSSGHHTSHKVHNPGYDDTGAVHLVGWYGPDDLENPQNWSSLKKLLTTIQICLLNFGIYVGSSIYTPGELSVMEEFGANEVVATLGLSLFVL